MIGLDIQTGDLVQLRASAKQNAGRVGRVIGIQYAKGKKAEGFLLYTVQFTDKEAVCLDAGKLNLLRATKPHESGRKDIDYERR